MTFSINLLLHEYTPSPVGFLLYPLFVVLFELAFQPKQLDLINLTLVFYCDISPAQIYSTQGFSRY